MLTTRYSLLIVGLLVLAACKEKPQSDQIIVTKYVIKKPKAPIKMAADTRTTETQWGGKACTVSVERTPADSTTMVKDADGQQYIDNRVTLKVATAGSVLFEKTFTKNSFAAHLSNKFLKSGILESVLFLQAEGGNLLFAVSISLPDNPDEIVPLALTIDRKGGLDIKIDQELI